MNDAGVVGEWVRSAQRIVLLSGAGMSAASGVPTPQSRASGLDDAADAALRGTVAGLLPTLLQDPR